jgi:hypothetical protein
LELPVNDRYIPRRNFVGSYLLAATAFAIGAADGDRPVAADLAAGKTGKERLTDKASDEQRVDDCKVPPAQRTRARSAKCQ